MATATNAAARQRPRRGRTILIIYLMGVMQFLLPVLLFSVFRAFSENPSPPPVGQKLDQFTTETVAAHRDSLQAMQEAAARAQALLGVQLTLYRPDGRLLASTSASFPRLSAAQIAQLERGETGFASDDYAVVPVREQGALVAYGLLKRERPDWPRSPSPPWVMTGIMLCIIAFIAVLSARALGKPLAELAGAARRFGEGELGIRMRWQRKDEFGDLARAFDDMADRLTSLLRFERELMANISHELRTPISRIRVALDIAEESDAETARQSLADISQDLSELERVIGDVLTATRLDSASVGEGGAPPLRRQVIKGSALVEAAAARFRSAHPARALEVRIESEPPEVEADPAMLRRVIDNLLDNARKYSEPDTVVVLEAREANAALEVCVRDQGIGIEAADLERLSTPFFRTDQSRTRASGGVGLGLTLVRRIVEAHGGTLRFESTPRVGTTVCFTVPRHAQTPGGVG